MRRPEISCQVWVFFVPFILAQLLVESVVFHTLFPRSSDSVANVNHQFKRLARIGVVADASKGYHPLLFLLFSVLSTHG